MKKQLLTLFVFCAAAFAAQAQTQTFNYTGSVQTFTVPPCVTSITVDVKGAQGGDNTGYLNCDNVSFVSGGGGRVQGTMTVTPGDVLYIYVGGKGTDNLLNLGGMIAGGYNGGGNGYDVTAYTYYGGSGGGGASDIRLNGTTLNDRSVVAGGGGGSGNDGCVCNPHHSIGGAGGGLIGGDGGNGSGCTDIEGKGGTQLAGGVVPVGFWTGNCTAGVLGIGGDGESTGSQYGGGGGGGGYYGGSGGGMGGGGGGSSYTSGIVSGVTHTQGFQTGNGQVILTYTTIGGVPSPAGPITGPVSVCQGATVTYSISSVVGATGYAWTVPVGATINSGQNTTSISVTFGTTSGNVTVTPNNSCGNGTPASLAVTVNLNPVVNLGPPITACGSALLDAQNPGSTYLWSTTATTQTITVTTSGSYTVTVTSTAGCSATGVVDVTINTPPTVALGADITQCGGTATLDAQNAGSTYLWSNSATTQTIVVSATGTYSVVVTDVNGCTGTDVIVVTINPDPVVTLTLNPSTVCVNWVAYTLTGGSPTGGTYSGTAVTANMFDPGAAGVGTYTITYTYTDVNGCTGSAQQTITVDLCTGIQATNNLQAVTVYPNPSTGLVNIETNADGEIKIFNLLGAEVFNQQISKSSSLQINLAQGVYTLQIITNLGVKTEKIVIEK